MKINRKILYSWMPRLFNRLAEVCNLCAAACYPATLIEGFDPVIMFLTAVGFLAASASLDWVTAFVFKGVDNDI